MMVQMLFSGMFIPFINITEHISYFVISRYGYEAFATIGNISQYGVIAPTTSFFDFNAYHVIKIWVIFIIISIIFLIASIITIKKNILEKDNDYLILDNDKSKLYKSKIKNNKN